MKIIHQLSIEFIGHLSENEILSHLTAPGMPQQNSVVERRNMIFFFFFNIVMSMMSYSGLPCFFEDMP